MESSRQHSPQPKDFVIHPDYGAGRITTAGDDYVNVKFIPGPGRPHQIPVALIQLEEVHPRTFFEKLEYNLELIFGTTTRDKILEEVDSLSHEEPTARFWHVKNAGEHP